MAFPTNGVLDDANRADGAPGANWTSPIHTDANLIQISSNQFVFTGGNTGGYWNPTTFGPDAECYVTWTTILSSMNTYVRVASPGASCNGYKIQWFKSLNDCRFHRIDSGTATQLGSTVPITYTNGDSFGVEMIGSTMTGYQKTGGTWSSIGSQSDSTYSTAGYIGVQGNNNGSFIDDFGGGAIGAVAAPPDPSLPLPLSMALRRLGHVPLFPTAPDPTPQSPPVTDAPDTQRPLLMGLRRVLPSVPIFQQPRVDALGVSQSVLPSSITATSAVAGTVVALKQVTPAAVSGTSSVTATIKVISPVIPASINATSAVTGTVTRLVAVKPASISSTSSVTASITKLGAVKPASISASSTVTASITKLAAITPASISSTSAVTAAIIRLVAIKPAAVNSTSAVSATVTRNGAVSISPAAITASSAVTGAVVARRAVSPSTVSATSAVIASLVVKRMLQGITLSSSSTVGGISIAPVTALPIDPTAGQGVAKTIGRGLAPRP